MSSFGKILALILFSSLVTTNLPVMGPAVAQDFTTPPSYQITTEIPSNPVPLTGFTFYAKTLGINYKGGKVLLSSNPDGTGNTVVDDAIDIFSLDANGKIKTLIFTHTYNTQCHPLQTMAPLDISHIFALGNNSIRIRLYDTCGTNMASSPLYLVTESLNPPPTPTPSTSPSGPKPFLDLPWDYGAKGMTFNEAAMSINAYFDHEYPFLSTSLTEPSSLISYRGGKSNPELDYSSHDGYDYGAAGKTKNGTPLVAPADGEAKFRSMDSCFACGNAILIDHKNGFQTRYYHLQPDGLIVSTEGQKVNIVKGQQLGKVGFSGKVIPGGEQGSHLHFMIVQDKNNDGNFEDNIPDGLVDPFGWQSSEPDPWESYAFNYAGKSRTGNKSYYLFTKRLDNLNETLSSNAKVFEVGKAKLEFPQGAANENLNLSIKSEPNFYDSLLNSLGSILNIEAKNAAGEIVTAFLKNFNFTINFSQFDLSRFNPSTLSIYSSDDGQNWIKENTLIDLNNKTASTSINHLTYFALMAERVDTIAPTTTPVLEGEKGQDNNFRSVVKVNLSASDNEGGLGVEFTAYSVDGGGWETYTTPLVFSAEGNHKVIFYSQDNDGNIEDTQKIEFSIDQTPPEAKIFIDPSQLDLTVEGIDQNPTTVVRLDNSESGKKDDAVYIISDLSGNTLKIDVRDRDKEKKDQFRIYSLQYNQNQPILLDQNQFNVSYHGKKEALNVKEQNYQIKDEVKIKIQYDSKKNQSTITAKESGSEKIKEIKGGLVLLYLQTSQGELEYSY